MSLQRKEKKKIIENLSKKFLSSTHVILSDYTGLTSNQFVLLRRLSIENKFSILVARNNLLKLSVKNTPYEIISEFLNGPVMIIFSNSINIGLTAKFLNNFIKFTKTACLKFKCLVTPNNIYSNDKFDYFVSMPTYKQSLCMLINAIQAPVKKLSYTLYMIPSKTINVFIAISKKNINNK